MKKLVVFLCAGIIVLPIFTVKAFAGDLEPGDVPGPTMYTLEEIYQKPIWGIKDLTFKTWASNPRFKVSYYQPEGDRLVWTDVVLDTETGLLWERTPDFDFNNPEYYQSSWYTAYSGSFHKKVGGRFGWRLPTIEELTTLLDDTTADLLPEGHPFQNIQYASYWSSSTSPGVTEKAFVLIFSGLPGGVWAIDKTNFESRYKWCVRGGNGRDGY